MSPVPREARVLVLCDFDGTITERDLTNVVWDEWLHYDWRAQLVPESERGLITATEMMRRGYAEITQSEAEIIELLRPKAKLRRGFVEFVRNCETLGWSFIVVSNGLRFYIEALLPVEVPVWAHEAHFDGQWYVDAPSTLMLREGEDFKTHVVHMLRAQNSGSKVAYVGDGRLDFEPSKLCDEVYCVRGSALEKRCDAESVAAHPFGDFDELRQLLMRP
ncbi:MAG TPA: MtnX-like HAD-IB family phosphatase [Polyangiaceae bacterium]|nr:MtnX-like HAD-IB family phosphatase [Polyangiaceae bacterium]